MTTSFIMTPITREHILQHLYLELICFYVTFTCIFNIGSEYFFSFPGEFILCVRIYMEVQSEEASRVKLK